eukprot:9655303-Karenia_brevis.AAC.1
MGYDNSQALLQEAKQSLKANYAARDTLSSEAMAIVAGLPDGQRELYYKFGSFVTNMYSDTCSFFPFKYPEPVDQVALRVEQVMQWHCDPLYKKGQKIGRFFQWDADKDNFTSFGEEIYKAHQDRAEERAFVDLQTTD